MPKEKRSGSEKPSKNKKKENDTVTLTNGKSNDKKKNKKSSPSTSSTGTSQITNLANKQISHNKSLSEPGFVQSENRKLANEENNSKAASSPLPISNIASSASLVEYSPNLLTNNLNSTKTLLPLSTDPNGRTASRSNDRFHQLFPSVPLGETVVDTYSCAYVKSLNLLHGVMFLTKNYICFYSKILTSENILILKLKHINSITKTMHALIFPTAIRIETQNSAYSFTSFRSRSSTLDRLTSLLNKFRQKEIDLSNKFLPNEPVLTIENSADEAISISNKITSSNEMSVSEKSVDITQTNLNESNESNTDRNQKNKTNSDNKSGDFFLSRNVTSTRQNQSSEKNIFNQNNNNIHKRNTKTNIINQITYNSNSNQNYYSNPNKFIYHFDYSDLSRNKVTVSLRHKKTLIEKVKILLSLLIPGFFEISRIDSLLPICFLMCVFLLLNAFVLLNKVNHVDLMFSDLLLQEEF